MSLSNIYDLVEDIQEFGFILTNTLRLQELLTFSLQQIASVRSRISKNIQLIYTRGVNLTKQTDIAGDNQPGSDANNGANSCLSQDLQHRLVILEKEMKKLRMKVEQMSENGTSYVSAKDFGLPVIHETAEMTSSIPPPPPPPLPPMFQPRDLPRKVLKELNVQKEHSSQVDMLSILRGIREVKLRPTEKSPGGTPLRRLRLRNSNDPNDLIREALKKRFECIQPLETTDKENMDDSWEQSPNRSFMC